MVNNVSASRPRLACKLAYFPISAEQGDEMDAGYVADLVKDFTVRLSAIADEFSERADVVSDAAPLADQPGKPEQGSKIAAVRELIEGRQLRHRFLPAELFHEPAWDMLLTLYVCWHDNRVINVKSLAGSTKAPLTTCQRWIDHLAKLGLVTRNADMVDRRRIEVFLSDSGRQMLERYLSEIGQDR